MRLVFLYILIFLLFSCGRSFPGKEQVKEYEKIQEVFREHESYLLAMANASIMDDSAKIIFSDVLELDAYSICDKYDITKKEDFDKMLQAMNVTVKILEAFDNLNNKLNESNEILKSKFDIKTDSSEKFNFKKIESLKMDTSKYKIVIASYDSTELLDKKGKSISIINGNITVK